MEAGGGAECTRRTSRWRRRVAVVMLVVGGAAQGGPAGTTGTSQRVGGGGAAAARDPVYSKYFDITADTCNGSKAERMPCSTTPRPLPGRSIRLCPPGALGFPLAALNVTSLHPSPRVFARELAACSAQRWGERADAERKQRAREEGGGGGVLN
ncbi:hypothetical protein DFH27DRAFT_574753 [Peziza echinospora]|nr:hypothetical protein DFH27DRAFT_574753 [Peziza echinospora]